MLLRPFQDENGRVKDLDHLRSTYLEAAEAGMEVMVQEFIPGKDADG